MTMRVTARVKLNTMLVSEGYVELRFSPDYEDGRNKEWANKTPTINYSMVVRPEIAAKFSVGDKYTVTFTEQED